MERIGRVLQWKDGVATVEVGPGACSEGTCADCRSGFGEKWSLQARWPHPCKTGQRVMVKSRAPVYRFIQAAGFFLVFCLVLGLSVRVVPRARMEGPEQRWAVVAGIACGGAAWEILRRWARGRPRYRLVPLDFPREVASMPPEAHRAGKGGWFLPVEDLKFPGKAGEPWPQR